MSEYSHNFKVWKCFVYDPITKEENQTGNIDRFY